MTTPATRPFALLACFALSAFAIPAACNAADRGLTPVERTPAAAKPLGQLVSNTAQRHTVAKPAYPVWEDAARLMNDRRAESSTAQRRTAYQNPPDPLNLRGLSDGFREGARPLAEAGQRASEWIDGQARGVAEGTRRLVDQTGQNLRQGTQSALNGTADTLERVLPGSTNPYAERAQYDADDFGYNQESTPTRANDNQFASPDTDYRDAQLRDAQLRADQQRRDEQERARRQREADSLAAERAYQQRLEHERAMPRSGDRSSSFVERFADDSDRFAEQRAPLAPVRRTETNRVANDQDAWRPFDDDSTADNYPPRTSRDYGNDPTGFPALNPPRTDWDAGLTRGQSPNPSSGYGQQAYNPGVAAQPTQGGTAPVNSGNPSTTSWSGQAGSQQLAGTNTAGGFVGANTAGDVVERENSTNLDRLLLVILGAASCFTWLAYYDVRQKYRLALRGVQVSDFGSQSVAA